MMRFEIGIIELSLIRHFKVATNTKDFVLVAHPMPPRFSPKSPVLSSLASSSLPWQGVVLIQPLLRMARKLRHTPSRRGALLEITCRTVQSRFLLRPDSLLTYAGRACGRGPPW